VPHYTIRAARPEDLAWLPAIELAAARLLVGHAPECVLTETTAPSVLQNAQRLEHLWVAMAADVVVGFALVEVIESGAAHLEELDVHPEHGRRGLGKRLVLHVCDWAARNGYEAVTLTTFRHVPWNMPFYSRLGFTVVPREHLSANLCAVVDDEARRGLDPSCRVVMAWRRDLARNIAASSGVYVTTRGEHVASEASDIAVTLIDPTPDDVQYLEDRLYEFNSSTTGIAGGEWLALFARENGRVVGGICGNTWGGTCEVRQFWVDPAHRGRGLGTRLFDAAQREASRRGCTQIVLMTFSFQAPAFYERRGFEILATIEDDPAGYRNLLMRKRLDSESS